MDEFLTLTREALNELEDYSKVHVVIGNESCDLDSTVSTLVYAYYLYTIDEDESVLFLPLMQIPRSKFRLRLETVHFLEKIGIEPDILTFHEEISLVELQTKGKLLVTLVDHHVLTPNLSDLESSVVKVIDHRPISKQWPTSVDCRIEPVGSCCTLIAEDVLANPDFPFDGIVNVLLYGTILIDTINMSPEAGKTTDKDTLMIQKLEDTLEEMGVDRDTLYEDLNDAKFDLSGLTTSEILDKDMKLIHGNNLIVAMCSVTMEMKELLTRPDLEPELKKLSQEKNAEVVIVMTLSNQDGSPTRQLALYSENRIYKQQISDVLVACQSPSLQLELIPAPIDNIQAYIQGNVQASRKKILPLVKGFLTGEPSPDEAINQLQNTVSPGDQGSNSSVIGAMADSGKGESDHEQHILSNETMSPEVMDMFDPFSTQLNTIDNSEKNKKGSDLFQDHTNETSSSNQWSSGSMINDINMAKSSDSNNSEVKANNTQCKTSILSSNDVFNIEPAVTNSSLPSNHLYENNNTNNEEDHFELTEADMYNFGVNTNLGTESPLDYASGANSGQASIMSSYPVTPPNSYFDSDLMNRQHDLPSFNNSEMVQIIKARQASMGKSDSENNSDGEHPEPFTPANSYISDNFNTFAKETNLPSFQNSDLVSKIREKRESLDNASGGETLGVNFFPYTPHNSYVDKSFDQFAAHGFSGPELTKRLSEERFDTEADFNMNNEFSGISTTDKCLESAQLDEASKLSDLLSMGLVKSGSSDTESSGDVNSPNEPVVVQDMIPAEHSANSGLLSAIPKQMSEERQVDDLFKSILNDSGASDSLTEVSNNLEENLTCTNIHGSDDNVKPDDKSADNVVQSKLSEQMSLNQQMSSDQSDNLFDDLLGGSLITNTDGNQIATNLSQQLSSDHPENLFHDLLGDSDVSLIQSTDIENEVASNLTQQLSSDQPEDLFNDLLGNTQRPSSQLAENTTVGSNLTQHLSSDQPEGIYNDVIGGAEVSNTQSVDNVLASDLTQQIFSDQPEDLLNDLMSNGSEMENIPASQLSQQMSTAQENLSQILSDQAKDQQNDTSLPSKRSLDDNAENLLDGLLTNSDTKDNVLASNIMENMSFDNPAYYSSELENSTENNSNDLLNDLKDDEEPMKNVIASKISTDMSDEPESIQTATSQLLQDLCEEPKSTNVLASGLADSLSSQQSEEDLIYDTKPNITDQSFDFGLMNTNNSFDNINVFEEAKNRQQTNSAGSFEDNFDPNSNAFDPFSSLLSDEPEDNRNIFDPFAPIKSEEDSPTNDLESNTTSSNEESTNPFRQTNPFDPIINVEESMSSQHEQVFDPFSTISTEGEQIVSGFGDNDESSRNLSNSNLNSFSNVSDQPEADQIPSSEGESALREENTTDSTDVLNFQQSFGSDPSPSFETGISKDSVSSADEIFDQNILVSYKEEFSTLKPNFDGIRNTMVHQPSIQSDLSTSFDFNEGNSETYSDVSPMETKDRFGAQELIPEEPDESLTQSVPTVVEKSHLGKLIGAELVHQPSIQSDLSTSFDDKSDYMIDSNPLTPIDNPSISDNFSKPMKPSDLPLQSEDDMDKSGVYFPESGVKFLQPESDSSLYNESSENEEVSPSQDSNQMVHTDLNNLENDHVDPAIEEQLLKTSSQLVENAFKEALDIEAAHIREERESEAKPQALEDEDTESNATNDADESLSSTMVNVSEHVNDVAIEDEQIAEEAIREVAVSFTDELIKEALDTFDEVIESPSMSNIAETDRHLRRAPPLNKSNNSLSLETDYLPEMDPLRGNLDIFSGAEHSATISTDAEREVAEAASFRKISSEESPSQHLEILEKLREEAERNCHVEATSEELRQATLEDSLDYSDECPEEFSDIEKQTNENIQISESLYDNLADTPSSEILEPFPDPVDTEPIFTADHVQGNLSSLPQNDYQSNGAEVIENTSADSSDPFDKSSTDDMGMLETPFQFNEYQDSASAEMLHAIGEPVQNQSIEPKVIVQEQLEKIAVKETFSKQNSTQNESGVNSVTETVLDSTNENLSMSYGSLSDKEKKEVYMTSAGRISLVRGESVASTESGLTSLTTDPRLEKEHQQVVAEATPTPTESKVNNDVIYKDEWQDEELPPMLDGEEVRQRDDSAVNIESPMPDDTPVKSSSSEPIEEYTAAQELQDAKRWKVVNVGEKEYRIDLIVIEPYKKVISHGGYYGEGLNALIVFSGCYLPDKRRKDYQYVMEHLFVYVVHTLEELVAEDYMIVYFHGATPKKQSPSFSWLKKCYQMIDRRLKKNLKSLFLVHPTLWLRTVVLMTKPFISSKFSSKLKFVKTLQDLGQIIPMQNLNIPDAVKVYDEKIYQSLSTPSTTPSTPS